MKPASSIISASMIALLSLPVLCSAVPYQALEAAKVVSYTQTSAAAPTTPSGYSLGFYVEGLGDGTSSPPTLSGVTFDNDPVYSPTGVYNAWIASLSLDDQNAFDAINGTYTATMGGVSGLIDFGNGTLPPVPVFTTTGGSWIDDSYVVDAESAFSATATFGDYTGDAYVFLTISGPESFDYDQIYDPIGPQGYDFASGELAPGSYFIAIQFAQIVHRDESDQRVMTTLISETGFSLLVIPEPATGTALFGVLALGFALHRRRARANR